MQNHLISAAFFFRQSMTGRQDAFAAFLKLRPAAFWFGLARLHKTTWIFFSFPHNQHQKIQLIAVSGLMTMQHAISKLWLSVFVSQAKPSHSRQQVAERWEGDLHDVAEEVGMEHLIIVCFFKNLVRLHSFGGFTKQG